MQAREEVLEIEAKETRKTVFFCFSVLFFSFPFFFLSGLMYHWFIGKNRCLMFIRSGLNAVKDCFTRFHDEISVPIIVLKPRKAVSFHSIIWYCPIQPDSVALDMAQL